MKKLKRVKSTLCIRTFWTYLSSCWNVMKPGSLIIIIYVVPISQRANTSLQLNLWQHIMSEVQKLEVD